ncbi:CMP-N-acetylneuraminate-beta-galactosamide-alpha-2, 3-sialyltransferase [Pasteurellaceae bacterium Orientalotternb1]|nr:CMP-N-acetylneuraminate-beta-galactosamide-alpha-2, 3-sialyltransferase [Pasteurellaceae bacterium Orientalotternb1]
MNLIICYTPLQVLIAEKIIDKYPQESFYGVMIYSVDNPKFQFYIKRLAQKCDTFFSFYQHTDRFNLLKEIIQIKCQFKGEQFDKVFVASINDIQIQFLLSSVQFNSLYTFDDGTANIVNTSVYYSDEPNTFIRKVINGLLNNKYSVAKLKALSKKHYTIYPDFPNIIANTEYVDIFNLPDSSEIDESNVVNILLGQPVYLDNQANIALADQVIKRFNIGYYLPHPREQYKLDNVTYIETPLIFEDYMTQHFANQKCRVYTYFSSAVLNIKNPNIETIGLRIETDNLAFIACYDLLEQANIPVIDIRE